MIIDVHTHYVPVAYLDYVRSHGASIGRELITVSSGETIIKDHERAFPLERGFYDEELKISHMARQGVDRHVASVPPFMFHYEAPPETGERMAQLFNDEAMALSKRHPERFIAMATLPLQDPQRGVRELERVSGLGIKCGRDRRQHS